MAAAVSAQIRELRYAREIVKMGVATFVIDSFKPRGVTRPCSDQSAVTTNDMLADAFRGAEGLAAHPRIDGKHIGITGFSKAARSLCSRRMRARRAGVPEGLALRPARAVLSLVHHQHYKPKTTGAPIYMLLGGADTYVGVEPCRRYAESLKRDGASVDWSSIRRQARLRRWRAYHVARGENYSRCVFVEQPDGAGRSALSGITTDDSKGRRSWSAYKKALAACRTLGVSGGPDPAARAKSMAALKSYVQRHLWTAIALLLPAEPHVVTPRTHALAVRDARFLIVGGASLVGSATAELLLAEGAAEVTILDNFFQGSTEAIKHLTGNPRLKTVTGDVMRLPQLIAATAGMDGVLHLAALMSLTMDRDPWMGIDVNIRGTQNVIEACCVNGVSKLVFPSSTPSTATGPASSATSWRPRRSIPRARLRPPSCTAPPRSSASSCAAMPI
jgi:dienelactone hydrolase